MIRLADERPTNGQRVRVKLAGTYPTKRTATYGVWSTDGRHPGVWSGSFGVYHATLDDAWEPIEEEADV